MPARLRIVTDGITTLEKYLKGEVSDGEKIAVKQLVEKSGIIVAPARLKDTIAGLITRFNNDPQAIKGKMLFDGTDESATPSVRSEPGGSELQMPRAPHRA